MACEAMYQHCGRDGSWGCGAVRRLDGKLYQVLSYLRVIESVESSYAEIRGCNDGLFVGPMLVHGSPADMMTSRPIVHCQSCAVI
jgi:hypothetical protein